MEVIVCISARLDAIESFCGYAHTTDIIKTIKVMIFFMLKFHSWLDGEIIREKTWANYNT